MKIRWKPLLGVALVAGVSAWLAVDHRARGRAAELLGELAGRPAHAGEDRPDKAWTEAPPSRPEETARGILTLTDEQVKGIDLKTVPVKAQTEPVILRLPGVTDYDPATLTIVRPQFDSRVDRVLVDLGTVVKQGDPLLEIFSTELAEAKSNYELARSQWIRDKRVLDYKTPLAQNETLPRKELIEIENDEAKSRLQMKLAKDKLLVYGLTEKEVEDAQKEDGVQKARMTMRSRADGIVVKRSVVQGNYYDSKDELMQVAPLDHLWVRGSVSELDADKVEIGQKIRVIFPYSDKFIEDHVEYIDKAIDPETRSARFRASITNPEKRFKAGMFVKVRLEIPPKPDQTVIPRGSMVSVDRLDFVFIRKEAPPGKARFERRHILVASESSDWVVVPPPSRDHLGLKPGEEVVTNGSLILEQLYEDRLTTEGETPRERPIDDETFGKPEKPVVISAQPSVARSR
ncbi:Cobalt-zinc-cadmium resistance protein CzcB [Aquisphaera giovannonii]|uniref:Cobalt-zinc-cadmium resistance protein CzcB n=1 Tax=Aquisphaera giovannonii TaxID=406548 RepID=A0A5B9W3S3_9BACT|nr:efflux RND transporter periplasmic adaptor subunit [Aquisphaera giovannonii]QEH34610.1 Cobalt-zinc-cadmium resistance protein CzcB [Aquisphaera giovannonii]